MRVAENEGLAMKKSHERSCAGADPPLATVGEAQTCETEEEQEGKEARRRQGDGVMSDANVSNGLTGSASKNADILVSGQQAHAGAAKRQRIDSDSE